MSMFLCMVMKALETTDMVFIYVLVKCGGEWNIGLDSSDPLINTAFNLSIINISTYRPDIRECEGLTAVRTRARAGIVKGLKYELYVIPSSCLLRNHIVFTTF